MALGLGNYSLGVYESLGRSMVLQVIISFLIGYPLLVLGDNANRWWPPATPVSQQYFLLLPAFFLIGVVGTEGQRIADALLFTQATYHPFQAGGVYLFNGILSSVLGLLPSNWKPQPAASLGSQTDESPLATSKDTAPLTKIPLRKGDSTAFRPLQEVIYFEAYDNYAFLYDVKGERSLCNYSLGYLEDKLDQRFLRVHRKYLINTELIASISPHLKGRYVITFTDAAKSSVRSSAGYTEEVKALLRL